MSFIGWFLEFSSNLMLYHSFASRGGLHGPWLPIFFFFSQKTAYELSACLVGSDMWIRDRDHIIAAAGNGKKNYDGKPVSRELEQFIEARGCQVTGAQEKECRKLTLDDNMQYQTQALATIICEGDAIGAVALCSAETPDNVGEVQGKLAQAAAVFLAKQVEQ